MTAKRGPNGISAGRAIVRDTTGRKSMARSTATNAIPSNEFEHGIGQFSAREISRDLKVSRGLVCRAEIQSYNDASRSNETLARETLTISYTFRYTASKWMKRREAKEGVSSSCESNRRVYSFLLG